MWNYKGVLEYDNGVITKKPVQWRKNESTRGGNRETEL